MAGRILPITRKRFVMSDRAEFEKWYDEATDCNYGVAYYVDITGRYCHHDIGIAWQAWQAALAKSRQCAEPVAEVWPSHHYVRQNHINWLVDVDDLPNGAELYTQPQPAQQDVPEGWKLVPVEPTDEMRRKAGLHRGADFYTIS